MDSVLFAKARKLKQIINQKTKHKTFAVMMTMNQQQRRTQRHRLVQIPLDCVAERLRDGDYGLGVGEAICYTNPGEIGRTLEFGLDNNGHPVYWDHYNHDPEVLIWTDKTVKGTHLEIQGNVLVLVNETGIPTWSVGECESESSNEHQLVVSKNGVVSLGSTNGTWVSWEIDLNGTPIDYCLGDDAGDEDLSSGGLVAAIVVAACVFLVFTWVGMLTTRRNKVSHNEEERNVKPDEEESIHARIAI